VTSSTRLLVTVLLLAPVALACGKEEERAPSTTEPASPGPGAAATGTLAAAPSPALTATTPPPPAGMAAPAVPAGHPATAPPKRPATTDAAPPPSTSPPTVPASDPPPTTKAEWPVPEPPAPEPAAPARPAAQRPGGVITLPAKLGAVSFDHERHAREPDTACTTCHHPSRSEKPLASENQACRDCHTAPSVPPMKTSLQAAFHDPKGAAGTCIDCHRKAADGKAPVKCLECHRKK
jgi:hypothetical protein